MLKRFHIFSALMVMAAVLVTACSPAVGSEPGLTTSGDGAGYYDEAAKEIPLADGIAVTEADAAYRMSVGAAPANAPAAVDRLVIKNASLSLVVKDPAQSVSAISQLAEAMGGFVVSSNTYQASLDEQGNKIMQGYITIRVPAEKLSEALTQLKGMAVTVNSENVSGEDVTAQYTDLESQLTNLEAAEAQLQEIMEGATRTEDVLNVYNQLVSIRGQIEMVKGQMKYYRESAAMSLISIDLIPDALSQPLQVAGWQPQGVVKEAFEALVRDLQGIADFLIRLVVHGGPLALLFGLPLLLIGRVVVKRLRRWMAKPTTA
jgi:hypothetical protein